MKANKTQRQTILEHLQTHCHITAWDAISKYHITRLSEYIRVLRSEGLHIVTENITTTTERYGNTTVAKYKLKTE